MPSARLGLLRAARHYRRHNFQRLDAVPGLALPFGVDHQQITHAVILRDFVPDPRELLVDIVEAARDPATGASWLDVVNDDQDQVTLDLEAPAFPWLYEQLEPTVLAVNREQFGLTLTYWQQLRINRYRAGAKVGHRSHSDYQAPQPAKLAFSLILREPDAGGGMTVENFGPLNLRAGDLAVFPAYEVHGVDPVTAGERVSLTGWAGGPPLR